MAKRKTHREDCLRLLGDEYDHVHKYLDYFAAKWPPPVYLEYHRKFRHNRQAVEKCKEMWGFYAERAAMIHIIRDNELYILAKPMDQVEVEEIEHYYERALHYCPPIANKKKINLQEGERIQP
jgi:hypothetical protein